MENLFESISKAYTEGIYADTPANRKLGRVGMTYTAYAEKKKQEEEDLKPKKNYWVTYPGGDTFQITDGPCSKDKIIEETIKMCKDSIKYNGDKKITYDIEEEIDWDNIPEDEDFSKYDKLQVTVEKNGSYIDVTVIDWNHVDSDSFFLRNDKLEREQKARDKAFKEKQKKDQEEFNRKFGWMKEIADRRALKRKLNEKMENILIEKLGFNIELTVRSENNWTLSYEGNDSTKLNKIKEYFNSEKYKSNINSDYDEELNETFVYIDIQDTKVNKETKSKIQKFLNSLDINEFKLGYGGYLFSQKDREGNYKKLSLSMIKETDLEKIKNKLNEENIKYTIKDKVNSSQEGYIKDLNIFFN